MLSFTTYSPPPAPMFVKNNSEQRNILFKSALWQIVVQSVVGRDNQEKLTQQHSQGGLLSLILL